MLTKKWSMIVLSLLALSALGLAACGSATVGNTPTVGAGVATSVVGTGVATTAPGAGAATSVVGTGVATTAPGLGTGTAVVPGTGGTAVPSGTAGANQPSVTVSDQAITNGTVTVKQAVSNGPGWVVIHADNNGQPGAVIGYSPLQDGVNNNVVVQIDANKATPTLYAMLHTDAGTIGTFEFPGPDAPVMLNGQVVMQSFTVTGAGG